MVIAVATEVVTRVEAVALTAKAVVAMRLEEVAVAAAVVMAVAGVTVVVVAAAKVVKDVVSQRRWRRWWYRRWRRRWRWRAMAVAVMMAVATGVRRWFYGMRSALQRPRLLGAPPERWNGVPKKGPPTCSKKAMMKTRDCRKEWNVVAEWVPGTHHNAPIFVFRQCRDDVELVRTQNTSVFHEIDAHFGSATAS